MSPRMNFLFAIAIFAANTYAQGLVQVSSVTADPPTLNCSKHSSALVDVQVYFTGVDTSRGNPAATIRLSTYSAEPSGNRLELGDQEKTVELKESPAIAHFEVSCSSETRPGEVKVAAAAIKAPAGVEIKPPPPAGITTIKIDHSPE